MDDTGLIAIAIGKIRIALLFNQYTEDDEHAGHHIENFLKRFWICVVVTIPVLLLSHIVQQWIGFEWTFTGGKYVLISFWSTMIRGT
ncbi:MAG TPA: hypothetical protein VK625_15345 [Flavitalea sp.]|nr:hypothetical protein [Flavitalea sp.]